MSLKEVTRKVKVAEGNRTYKRSNPYPEFLIDEASGIQVRDLRHELWAEGYEAGRKDSPDA